MNPERSMSDHRFLLDPQSLATKVSVATFERGLAVYRNQQVMDCALFGANAREWRIEGDVMGSGREIYEVSVILEASPQGSIDFFSGDCSCPVASNCKHSVALVLKAAYKSNGVRANAGSAPVGLSAAESKAREAALERVTREREHQQAQHKVRQWLDLFGEEPSTGAPAAGEAVAVLSGNADHLVYMLSAIHQGSQPVLQLAFGRSRRLRNGNWAKVKQPTYVDEHGATAQDLEIMRLVYSLAARTYSYSATNYQCVLSGQAGLLALKLAAATRRLFSLADARVLDRLVSWGPARPMAWNWSEATTLASPEPLWTLRPQLADAVGGAQWFANTPPLYLDADAGLCGPVETPGVSPEHLALLLKAPPIPLSAFAKHETTLLRRLAGLPLPQVLTPPEVIQGVTPSARLQIARVPVQDVARLGLLCATLRFDYDGLRHYAHNNLNPVLMERDNAAPVAHAEGPLTGTRRLLLHRDLAAEQAATDVLHAWGLAGDVEGRFHLPFVSVAQQQAWLEWADTDFAPLRGAGFGLEVDPGLGDWILRADALDVQLAPQGGNPDGDDLAGGDDSRSPWFDLSLGMDIDGRRHNILPLLPALLAQIGAASHGQPAADGINDGTATPFQLPPYVYLPQDDGNYLRLPTEPLRPWLQALLDLMGERGGTFDGDTLRLSRLEALRVGASLGESARWSGADSLRQMVRQLGGRDRLPELAAPAGLLADLRPYQQQGLEWLQFLRAHGLDGILADDMGLGKTLQTLAHILVEKQAGRLDRPVLIIAPVSVMGNWRREAGRFTPQLSALVLHGKERHEAAVDMALHDLVIAPYSLLQRDRDRWLQQPWHLVVLDEAQNIKNANTHAARIAGELNTRHRLCLSGTPMENHLGELWSLFHFLMPGFLGSQARFKELFRTPIEKHGDSERLDQLRRRITPFMLRRAKRDVATDLPEKQEAIVSVELGGKQADLYETIRLATEKAVQRALADKGLAQSRIQILDALLKLRQVCCDPRLVPLPAAKKIKQSAKLERLMEMLPEMLAEGRRVLLFSQFTGMLALIEQELTQHAISWVKLTGQSQKRDQLIERFTSGAVPLFLISLKAGGVGLNLTQADTVIHYDPWWNPAVETQATDRAHRIGQTQRVLVYKLVAQGTIEERILALQERKAALADSMYSTATARKQPLFTESDLSELLKPLGT